LSASGESNLSRKYGSINCVRYRGFAFPKISSLFVSCVHKRLGITVQYRVPGGIVLRWIQCLPEIASWVSNSAQWLNLCRLGGGSLSILWLSDCALRNFLVHRLSPVANSRWVITIRVNTHDTGIYRLLAAAMHSWPRNKVGKLCPKGRGHQTQSGRPRAHVSERQQHARSSPQQIATS
jgi:hypothetical protein